MIKNLNIEKAVCAEMPVGINKYFGVKNKANGTLSNL